MVHVVLHSLVHQIFILCTVLNLIMGDKFIGKYLNGKVKNYLVSTSNGTNHKLWIKYLEKRLEKISLCASRRQQERGQIFSVVQFYQRNVSRELLKKVHSLCENQHEKLQTGISESICASADNGIFIYYFPFLWNH